jgi:hypothetical protein
VKHGDLCFSPLTGEHGTRKWHVLGVFVFFFSCMLECRWSVLGVFGRRLAASHCCVIQEKKNDRSFLFGEAKL